MLPYTKETTSYIDTRNWLSELDLQKLDSSKRKRIMRVTVGPELIAQGAYSGFIDWSRIDEVDMDEVLHHAKFNHPLALALQGIFPKPCVSSRYITTGYGQEYATYTTRTAQLIKRWDNTRCERRVSRFPILHFDLLIWEDLVNKYNLPKNSHIRLIDQEFLIREKITDMYCGLTHQLTHKFTRPAV